MSDNGVACVFGAIMITSGVMFVGGVSAGITHGAVDDWWRDYLAKRGVAEYYLDANNQRQWHMKEGKQ